MASVADPPKPQTARHGGRLRRHLHAFWRAVRTARNRRGMLLVAGAIVAVICASTVGQVRLNAWQGDFYDAIAQRHWDAFLHQLLVFGGIIAALLTLGVSQVWLHETLKIQLRDAVTRDLLQAWLAPRRAYQLAWAGDVADNPDQRIQEDARHLSELCADLAVGLLQSTLLLVSFAGVLWLLSEHVVLELGGERLAVPGYMLWVAMAYALAASWLTWRVGRPLIALNAARYAREAELRFALVHVNEAAEAIGLSRAEADARRDLGGQLDHVLVVMRQLARGLAGLTWVTAGSGWLALVVPVVAAAPGYFSGSLSFGELMMTAGAFLQVQQALRWFVENFPRIADWRATLLRVMVLRLTLPRLDGIGAATGRIAHRPHPEGRLALRGLVIVLPSKRVTMDHGNLELGPGERVLIVGGPGSGKSMLFRAIAGLFPCGSGTVLLPPADRTLFLPQRPYIPLGSLRHALAYPLAPEALPDGPAEAALRRVGLGHLAGHLDEARRWDRELGLDEQQCLAFARLLVRRPDWVVMDDALSALGEERRAELMSVFDGELRTAAVLGIGRTADGGGFFRRVLSLSEDRSGAPHPRPLPEDRAA